MANVLSKGSLFPAELTNEMFNMVKGKSSLAKLSGQSPIAFNGNELFTFNFDKEIDIVAENGAKSNGGASVQPITIVPIKVEYGTRVSDEFKYGSEEVQLQYLQAFAEGFARKVARGIDIMAFHGVNPRTMTASVLIGNNCFDKAISQTVTRTADADADVESAIALIQGNEEDVDGMAMSPAFRSALAALTLGADNKAKMFPELGWGNNPGSINGLTVDSNSTVSVSIGTPNTNKDEAIVGNFADYFRWGFAKEIPIEVIEYGNPDNDADAGDLKGHNQVYIRGEAYIGWGILNPNAFSRILSEAEISG